MHAFRAPMRSVTIAALALLLGVALAVSTVGTARALPTSDFTFAPDGPVPGEAVTFVFTGTCDVPPCAVGWRWFRDGGPRLGTSMGAGDEITYAFSRSGDYRVVAKITNAGSTHGSATATRTVSVQGTFEDHDRAIRYSGWRGVVDPAASEGGYRSASNPKSAASYTFSGTAISYVARTGPGLGVAAVDVTGRSRLLVDLYSPAPGTTSVTIDGLSSGRHRIRVRPTDTRASASSGTAITLDELVVGPRDGPAEDRVDDRSSAIGYGRWQGSTTRKAQDGSLRSARARGARADFSFTGTAVTWLTSRGPDQGRARVMIDGRRVEVADLYSGRRRWQVERTYVGLAPGAHVIKVVVLGRHDRRSRGNTVTLDGFLLD